jgi:hypothetical protein
LAESNSPRFLFGLAKELTGQRECLPALIAHLGRWGGCVHAYGAQHPISVDIKRRCILKLHWNDLLCDSNGNNVPQISRNFLNGLLIKPTDFQCPSPHLTGSF